MNSTTKIIYRECLSKFKIYENFLGKGKMETFWLIRKLDKGSVRGYLLNRRQKLSPQISFNGIIDEGSPDTKECPNVRSQ